MVQGRQYTDEFKREAVGLLASSGRPLLQIAKELGISPSMLRYPAQFAHVERLRRAVRQREPNSILSFNAMSL